MPAATKRSMQEHGHDGDQLDKQGIHLYCFFQNLTVRRLSKYRRIDCFGQLQVRRFFRTFSIDSSVGVTNVDHSVGRTGY